METLFSSVDPAREDDLRTHFVRLLLSAPVLLAFASIFVHPFGAVKNQVSTKPLFAGSTIDAPIVGIIEKSCQNCHSERTEWPWYSYVAPMSWMIENDVRQGRSHMNLSRWDEFNLEEQQQILSKLSVMIRNRAMPLPRYLLLHPSARLSDAEIARISQWARSERKRLKYIASSSPSAQSAGGQ